MTQIEKQAGRNSAVASSCCSPAGTFHANEQGRLEATREAETRLLQGASSCCSPGGSVAAVEIPADVHTMVREAYGRVAEGGGSCCSSSSCGGSSPADQAARVLGYSESDLSAAPEGANLGLGCGNPIAQAGLKSGDVVVDLGSGAGFDAFLAARAVGAEGRVIGVDMTPQMLERARANAEKAGTKNVEFRQGYIESLPLGDATADVLISNCVINLSPDKPAVFREAFRILKDGGRLVVSDIVLRAALPDAVARAAAAYTGCIAGASLVDDYLEAIRKAGFEQVEVVEDGGMDPSAVGEDPITGALVSSISQADLRLAAEAVRHAIVRARKPAAGTN